MDDTKTLHKVFVYGTLRTGSKETYKVPGRLYSLGWFPGIKLTQDGDETSKVVCELREVDDETLQEFDDYEGYYKDNPEGSLYIRQKITSEEGVEAWIYVYNRPDFLEPADLIPSGDWSDRVSYA